MRDIGDLSNILAVAVSKWRLIGLQLMPGSSGLMDEVRADCQDQRHCLTRVLEEWLKSADSPTVMKLSSALKSPLVNEANIASVLCREFLDKPTATS